MNSREWSAYLVVIAYTSTDEKQQSKQRFYRGRYNA